MQSYKDLEIYQLSHRLAIEVHRMTLEDLPKFEMYEEGRQIRKSSKSIPTQKDLFNSLLEQYEELGKKLYRFRETIGKSLRLEACGLKPEA